MNISPIGNVSQKLLPQQPGTVKQGNFSAVIKHYIEQTNMDEKAADKAGLELALGKRKNVSETLVAIEKADMSFKLMLSVRNKLMSAYNEIMHMQA